MLNRISLTNLENNTIHAVITGPYLAIFPTKTPTLFLNPKNNRKTESGSMLSSNRIFYHIPANTNNYHLYMDIDRNRKAWLCILALTKAKGFFGHHKPVAGLMCQLPRYRIARLFMFKTACPNRI